MNSRLTTVVLVGAAGAVAGPVAVGGGGEAGPVGAQEAHATLALWGRGAERRGAERRVTLCNRWQPLVTVGNSAHMFYQTGACSRVGL